MTTTQHLQATRILIVDDSPANLLLLARMLGEKGYRTLTASSGKLALEAARAECPDLILLDITMPEMNGYETCEQIKADATLRDIPVIFISSLNETLDKVKAFGAGGVDYVTKPFQFEEVYARVQTHLQLRRLGRLRDGLTHMVVHDLRNPLTVICDFLDILEFQKAQVLSASTQALVTVARRSAEDLLTMIGSILDVAKMGAGEMSLQREPCDLGALVRALLDTIHPLPDNRTVTLEAEEPSLMAPVDVGLIRRVLQNLLGNALKYTPVGGDVRVVLTPSRGEVRIEVIDRGPGIAPEHHQRIFEKYGQVDDRRNRVGTGLGLAFCKLAVEAHGGRIGVESEVGKGSTFWVTLPRPEDGVGASSKRNAMMKEKVTRVLIVDDDASIGQVLKAGLEMHGFAVRYEARSTNAINACLDFHPDLVLLDIDMPVKDGGQVAAELRKHPTLRSTPVIFLSSLVERGETGKRNASHEVFLSKQIRITELVAIVRDVLKSS